MPFSQYGDVPLHEDEAEVLFILEEMLGSSIPDISNQSMAPFGFIHTNYHVTELRLTRSFFHRDVKLTKLPKQMGNLTELITLDASHNLLSSLPDTMVQMTELEHLYMDFNRFQNIPEFICRLSHLSQLNFDENQLNEIPVDLKNLIYLQSLQLSGNKFREIPTPILQLKYLRRLLMMRNFISSIPYEVVDRLMQLYVLDLRGNLISSSEISRIRTFMRLNGFNRPKFRLSGNLHSVEDPFSERNIRKKMESDPKLGELDNDFEWYTSTYLEQYKDSLRS